MNARARASATAAALLLCPAVAAQVFTDVTTEAGLDNPVDVQGVAMDDVDGDGDLDVYLPLVIPSNPLVETSDNQLWINDGTGVFTEDGAARGVADPETGFGACFGDFDGDGDRDLALANGLLELVGSAPLRLFSNDGAGLFADETTARGVSGPGSGRSVTWVDFDSDGDLDLFLATPALERLYLFRNDGDAFVDVTAAAGLDDEQNSQAAAWADHDGDGDQDLYVVNLGLAPFVTERNRLYRNEGDGTFTDVAPAAGVDDDGSGYGAAWGDHDNDGDLDLYVANGLDVGAVFGGDAPNVLYRNEGDGTFTDVSAAAGVDTPQVSFSAAWADVDQDGWLDLYVTNSPLNDSDPANVLYRNRGDGTFEDVSLAAGVDDSGSGQGTAFGDVDSDGDLDLFVANLFSDTGITARLYRNDSPPRHWLTVDTVGTESNRDGIGALVTLRAGALTLTRHVHAGSGYLSQDSLDVELGLGDVESIDELEIRWPSGCVQVVPSPEPDRRLVVVEDCLPAFDVARAEEDPCGLGISLSWEPPAFASTEGHVEVRRGADCASAAAAPELLPRPAGTTFEDLDTRADETWTYSLLAVDDVNGTSAELCAGPITDTDEAGFSPEATAIPNPACVGELVRFAAGGPAGASFSWDFDEDGLEDAAGALAAASWATPGTRLVRVAVGAPDGCVVEEILAVEILEGEPTLVGESSLRLRRLSGGRPELRWERLSGPGPFVVRRSRDAAEHPRGRAPAVASPSAATWTDEDADLEPGGAWFYRVAGAGCGG